MDAWSKCHICSHLISATVTISHFTPLVTPSIVVLTCIFMSTCLTHLLNRDCNRKRWVGMIIDDDSKMYFTVYICYTSWKIHKE